MPTTPDQDGAFFDSVGIQRPRTGPVGVPRTGGMAAPTSVPPRPPVVPGAGAAAGGRPPASGPAGSGVGSGVAPAPAAPPATSVQINMPAPTPTAPGAPTPQAGGQTAQPAVTSQPGQALDVMPTAALLPKIPSAREMKQYPPGTQLNTPYGPIVENPLTGKRSVKLTPEGQALYARDQQAMKAKLGPNPFNADPNAPQPRLIPGQMFFDPFSGTYID